MLQTEGSAAGAVGEGYPDPAGARRQEFVLLRGAEDRLPGTRSPAPAELDAPRRVEFTKGPHGSEPVLHLHEVLPAGIGIEPRRASHPAWIHVSFGPVPVHLGRRSIKLHFQFDD